MRRLAELEDQVERLQMELVAGETPSRRTPLADDSIEAAVAAWMEANGFAAEAAPDGAASGIAPPERPTIADLTDPNLTMEERKQLLQTLREQGSLDDAIAELELLAETDPLNPDVHQLLGEAYIERIQTGLPGEEAGEMAELADASFDRALELDPNDWDARYTKALSLSYWPESKGKQGEAIEQLQRLVQQQAGGSLEPRHVDSHLLLGSMYQRMGNFELAIQSWEAGLARFPENEELRSLLASARNR